MKKFQGASSPETLHFVLWSWSDHLAQFIPIVAKFELDQVKFVRVHTPPKPHILFYSDGLTIILSIDLFKKFQGTSSPETSHLVL